MVEGQPLFFTIVSYMTGDSFGPNFKYPTLLRGWTSNLPLLTVKKRLLKYYGQ